MTSNDQLKDYFKTGDKPTQGQFYQFIDELDRISFSSSMLTPTGSDPLPWDKMHTITPAGVSRVASSPENRGFINFDLGYHSIGLQLSQGSEWRNIISTINIQNGTSQVDDYTPTLASKTQMNVNAIRIYGCGIEDVNGIYVAIRFLYEATLNSLIYRNTKNNLYITFNDVNSRFEIKKSVSGDTFNLDNISTDPTILFKEWTYIEIFNAGSSLVNGGYGLVNADIDNGGYYLGNYYPIFNKGNYNSGTDTSSCQVTFNTSSNYNELKDYTGSVLYRWGESITSPSLEAVSGSLPLPSFIVTDNGKINTNRWVPSISCSILYPTQYSPITDVKDIVYVGEGAYQNFGTELNDIARGNHQHEYTAEELTTDTTVNIDFSNPYKDLFLEHDVIFTTSNLSGVKQVNMRIVTDGTDRSISWPVNWKWLNSSMPVSQSANISALLSLISWGTTDANVQAVYARE